MHVKAVMNPQCLYCGAGDDIASVARTMAKHDYGVVPVAKNEMLVGIVTDRGVVVRGPARWLEGKCMSHIRGNDILNERRKIKEQTLKQRRLLNQRQAAWS